MSYVTLQWIEPWHVQTQKTHSYKLELLHLHLHLHKTDM